MTDSSDNPALASEQSIGSRFWLADFYLMVFLLIMGGLVYFASPEMMDRGEMLFEIGLLVLFVPVVAIGIDQERGTVLFFFRSMFPLFPILYSFRVLHFLFPHILSIDGTTEAWLIYLDQLLFGQHVEAYFSVIRTPLLTELMYYFYLTYYVVPLIVLVLVFRKCVKENLDTSILKNVVGGFVLGFITSYVIYLLVPARGPWYGLGPERLTTFPLTGKWFGGQIREAILFMEMEMYDAFPSGHTEVFLIAVLYARRYVKSIYVWVLILFLGMVISTMYLQFHYAMDVLAGLLLGYLVFWFQETVYEKDE